MLENDYRTLMIKLKQLIETDIPPNPFPPSKYSHNELILSDNDIDKIRTRLQKKRIKGNTCNMWKQVGIKYLGDNGLWSKMLDWEKQYYKDNHRTLNEE
jgi:hypothetical protein